MSSFSLKVIAVVTMIIDHVGLIFFPDIAMLRFIGRLSFPLFAFLIAEGYSKTRNVKKYLLRLGLFALISHFPHTFALEAAGIEHPSLNIFFTLFVGLLALVFISKKGSWVLRGIAILSLLSIAEIAGVTYGAYGVLLIIAFYYFPTYRYASIGAMVTATLIFTVVNINTDIGLLQPTALLALFLISSYNHTRGLSLSKWWFYWFYPAHLIVLGLVKTVI